MKQAKLFYYYPKKNFGDQLNLEISRKLFNREPILAHPNAADFTMIGSIMESFILEKYNIRAYLKKKLLPPVKVFGSGFITEQKTSSELYSREMRIYAVRGVLTKLRFEKNLKIDLTKIILGDPGLLSSKLLSNKPAKKYSVGIIAHMINENDPNVKKLQKEISNSLVINILDSPVTVLSKISQCEIILSDAMHGLIAADSLGIPNRRIKFKNELIGGDFKFKDYYSAYDLGLQDFFDLRKETITDVCRDLKNVKKQYSISNDKVQEIQNSLIDSAPF